MYNSRRFYALLLYKDIPHLDKQAHGLYNYPLNHPLVGKRLSSA